MYKSAKSVDDVIKQWILHCTFRARDNWLVGTFIWEIFNGNNATSAASYRQLNSIPRPLSAAYGELVNSNPAHRLSLEKLIQSPFVQNNTLVECLLFLEQIQVGYEISFIEFFIKLVIYLVERCWRKTNVF